MRKGIWVGAIALTCVAYQGSAIAENEKIYINQTIPFTDENSIAKAILTECQLPERQAEYIEEVAKENGLNLIRDNEAVITRKGRVLLVEISNAISVGNPFTGHRKQVSIKGRLLEDGTEVASFSGLRSSMGGMFGGFKGSCVVLERCLATLAKDINGWLKAPTLNARIGE